MSLSCLQQDFVHEKMYCVHRNIFELFLWLASLFNFWTNCCFVEMHWIFWICHYHWEIFHVYWYPAKLSFEQSLEIWCFSLLFNSSTPILYSPEIMSYCGMYLPVLDAIRAILRGIFFFFLRHANHQLLCFNWYFQLFPHLCIHSEGWVIIPVVLHSSV